MKKGHRVRSCREAHSRQKEEQSQRHLGGNGLHAFKTREDDQYGLREMNKEVKGRREN